MDLKDELYSQTFEPRKDIQQFKQLRLDRELNTIVWDVTGADLAPEFLHEQALTHVIDLPRGRPAPRTSAANNVNGVSGVSI
ncbi:MAG: hypothetical protein WD042_18945 [Phycisphaeraceae bacterium]